VPFADLRITPCPAVPTYTSPPSTLEGGDFVFDLATGEISERRKPFLPPAEALTEPRFYLDKLPWIGVAIVSMTVFLLVFFLVRRRRRRS
jgi:hypothetical protein